MKTLFKLWLRVVIIGGGGLLAIAFVKFQSFQKAEGAGNYRLSDDCSTWLLPAQDFTQYLKVNMLQTLPTTGLTFMTIDVSIHSGVAFEPKTKIGFHIDGEFMQLGDFIFNHTPNGLNISRFSGFRAWDMIKKLEDRTAVISVISKIPGGQDLIAFNAGGAGSYRCAFAKGASNCVTLQGGGTQWLSVMAAMPDVKKALDLYCGQRGKWRGEMHQVREDIKRLCPKIPFGPESNPDLLCNDIRTY